MKIKKTVYRKDTFKDYDGNVRPVIMCAVSAIAEEQDLDDMGFDEFDECDEALNSKMLFVGVAIGHINDKDSWNDEKGKKIAFNKALSGKHMIITNTPGFISSELVDALLNKEMEYFKKEPSVYIKGYYDALNRRMKKATIEDNFNKILPKMQELPLSKKEEIVKLVNG